MLSKSNVRVIHITILALAITIIVYPYIAPVFYNLAPNIWGDQTEGVSGIPSAYDGISTDVKNFNTSILLVRPIHFINSSSYIVILTAWGNIVYRTFYLIYFESKIIRFRSLLLIDITINCLLVLFFWYQSFTHWFSLLTYYINY